jgi:hypothetical protein
MGYVVTIRDIYPPVRSDNNPWTGAKIQESADSLAWTLIDSVALTPLDTDPANPRARTLTTEQATLERGFYRVQFFDATNDTSSWSEVMENAALVAWAPSVREIAAIMRARTKNANGDEVGTFDETTRPTAAEVEVEIENQSGFMSLIVGFAPTISEVRTAAKNLTKLRTAMMLESSYWPEQIENGMSPFTSWQEQYRLDMIELKKIIDPGGDGGLPGTEPGVGFPSYNFPDPDLVGWETQF